MIRYFKRDDISKALQLMDVVKDDFAGYDEAESIKALNQAADAQEAFTCIDKESGIMTALLTFSRTEKELAFLAVHPRFRRNGIARDLIDRMKSCFQAGEEIYVITFCDDDPKGVSARKCYHSCGFKDAENLVVHDYPCQKMVCEIC